MNDWFDRPMRWAQLTLAENDPAHALAQPSLNAGKIAQTATKLHRNGDRAENCFDGIAVDAAPGKRTV